MEMAALKAMAQYGFSGVMVAVVLWMYWSRDRAHREERKEWREESHRREDHVVKVVENNSTVLTELKTIIHERHR